MATRLKDIAPTVEDALNELDEARNLSAALVDALAEIGGAAKGKINPHFKSKYADISSVIDAIKPVLARHGLGFTQHSQPSETGVIVETVVHHRSGDRLGLGALFVPANKNDAQGFGSALTYARRYSLMTAFGVPAEDDDGNAAASASARPTTGEAPPSKRVKLPDLKDGIPAPYPFITHLMTATHEFVRTLESMGDLEEFTDWGKTEDVQLYLKQLKRDLPGWWAGGHGAPDDWVPIEILISQKKRDLEQIAGLKVPA